jgi:hypothetical protein
MAPVISDQRPLVWAVLPSLLAGRIRRHYGPVDRSGSIPLRAISKLLNKFETDKTYQGRLRSKARELELIVFDGSIPDWRDWPADIGDYLLVGSILGTFLRLHLDEVITEMPEPLIDRLETESRAGSHCLEEIFISLLFEAKASVDPADWWEKWRAVKLFQRPAEMVHPVQGSVAASRVLAGTTAAPSGVS